MGESDETPASLADPQASRIENLYRWRNGLRRRSGFSALAASLGAENLRMLQWGKIGEAEHLVSVHGGDLRDWLHATPGTILPNGTDRLPASGANDANGAVVEGHLVVGNGIDENVRYNGEGPGLAADFTVSTTRGLKVAFGANALFAGADTSGVAWVWLDSLDVNATDTGVVGRVVIASEWDRSTASARGWRVMLDPHTDRFVFQVRGTTGTETEVQDTTALVINQWYCVRWRHNAATDQIAIQVDDGALVTAAHNTGINEPANVDFYAGGMFNGSNTVAGVLDGRLGPVGIWRSAEGGGGALSNTLLDELYNSGIPYLEADLPAAYDDELVAYWDMGEASGTRDDDHSAASTFNLLEFGGTTGSAEGPHGTFAVARQMPQAVTTAPTVDLDVGSTHESDTETQGQDFVYRISFLNADGEPGEAGPEGSDAAYTFNLDFTANLTNIPVCPAGQDCTGRRIWRRSGGSTVFRKVADILDNTTTTYLDEVLNEELGEALPADADGVPTNKAMPPFKYWCEHNSRLIGLYNTTLESGKRLLGISNKFEPWNCPELPDFEDPLQGTRHFLQGDGAGEGTGLCSHGAYVAVFTAGAGFFLTGDSPDTFAVNKFANHGCVAHRTIVSARDMLLWLGPEGVYAWQSGVTRLVSDDQRETIEDMTAAEMAGAHAFVWDDKYFLCWATGCIVLDLQYNFPHQWSTNTNWLWRDSTISEFTGTAKEKVYAALEGAARVYQLETGATDAGTAISARWSSKDFDMGLAAREKRAHYIEVRSKKGTGTLTVQLKKGSGQVVQTEIHNLSEVEHADETVSRFFRSCREEARSEFFRLDLTLNSAAAEPPELLAAGLHFTPAS